ncbi:restriction endonuclease subunit S [Methanosarcina mazei]|jgi:type I restriction enzyme S subunit|uniref:Type I restriction-modification system, specificity subunit S n=1 Tax=Methanosarcina mazei LYC TaxID=1434114 RepID=A0A0E3LWF4_METMZ|nr:restriction endonuclease subunit S [Methanosarcina mazei]AKB68676.1 Type I restriction-modification system, specificity subunit S [Methanosarcina mazei LYC]
MKTIKSLTEAEIAGLPQLSERWVWVRLDSIGELFCGQSPSIAEVNQEKRGVPYVTGPEQWDGSKIKETKWTEFPKRLVPEGCIFITVKGAGVGKIFPGVSCAIGRDIYAFLPSSKVDFKYTLHAIKHQIDVLIMKAQGDIPGLSKNHILDHVIGLCSIEEQRAIVSKIEQLFSELDNGISNLKLAQEQLKVYRQAVLKKAFEGELTKKWREQQTDLPDARELREHIGKEREEAAKKSGKKLKSINSLTEVKLSNLPKGWKWTRLGNLVEEPKYGTSKKCDYNINGIGVLRIPNISDGLINDSDLKFAQFDSTEIENYHLKAGDILTIRSNGSVDLVGKCALVSTKDEKHLYAGYLIRLRPISPLINSKYLLNCLSSIDLRYQIESKAKSTSGVNNINSGELQSLIIPFCSLPEQQAIVQEIETRLSVCDKIEQDIETNLEKAEALRQSILKKAFEGKLLNERELAEVRGAEDWEPAEVLLERIKAEKAQNGKKIH